MAAAAILKIAFLAITHRPIVRFQQNFVWWSKTVCQRGLHDKNCNFFKIQDGGRPPFWKSLNCHISVKRRPSLIKFGTLHHILNPITVTWPKIKILKIQDGGGRHLENRFFGHNSSTDFLMSAKFALKSRTVCRHRPRDKNCKFLKSIAILKIVKSPYLTENITRFWQNLVYYSRYWTWWDFEKHYHSILKVIRKRVKKQQILMKKT